MATTLEKTPVKTTWKAEKIQKAGTELLARTWMTAFETLCQADHKYVEEFDKKMSEGRIKHLKELGVKTPIDLVKAMSEFEANVFGSKMEIVGDEKEAKIIYSSCGMWEAMKGCCGMTKELEEKMGNNFQACMSRVGEAFGFDAKVEFTSETCAITTFTKK